MTRKLELDRIAQGAETRVFAAAIRQGNDARIGNESYTASGADKDKAPSRTIGAERFTASGDGKAIAGGRVTLAGDFTATGGKPKPAPALTGKDFTASGLKSD